MPIIYDNVYHKHHKSEPSIWDSHPPTLIKSQIEIKCFSKGHYTKWEVMPTKSGRRRSANLISPSHRLGHRILWSHLTNCIPHAKHSLPKEQSTLWNDKPQFHPPIPHFSQLAYTANSLGKEGSMSIYAYESMMQHCVCDTQLLINS